MGIYPQEPPPMPMDYWYYMLDEEEGAPLGTVQGLHEGYLPLYGHSASNGNEVGQEPREEPVGFFSGREAGEGESFGFGNDFFGPHDLLNDSPPQI